LPWINPHFCVCEHIDQGGRFLSSWPSKAIPAFLGKQETTMTTTNIKTIRRSGQRQCLSEASRSHQGGTKFEKRKVMKIRLLTSAVVVAVLANVGSALAEEPSAIGAYKAEVAKVVQSLVDARNVKLRGDLKSLESWYTVKSEKSSAVQKTAGKLDELKAAQQKLVNSKGDLVKSLAEASIAAVKGKVGADADIRKFNDQIKAKDKEIEDNDGKIRAQEFFLDARTRDDNRVGAELEKTKQEIANTSKDLASSLAKDIRNIQSPEKRDPKLKDPKANWGPLLAQFIKNQIATKPWIINVSAQVTWSQGDFASGTPPVVTVTCTVPPNAPNVVSQ
jgi:hypothetical protein